MNPGRELDALVAERAEGSFLSKPGFYEAYGLTAPHAICLAALKAISTSGT